MAVKLVQVGMGGWGRSWAKSVTPAVPDIEPTAFVEAAAEARSLAQQQLKASPERFFASLDEALSVVECDAVLVTTPVEGHVPLGLQAVAANKHVLVEKPLAMTAAAARPLAEAAGERNLIAMVSQNYRFYPAARKAAELIQSRALGRPRHVSIQFRRNLITGYEAHHRLVQPLLVDMAIHHFDLLRMVLQDEPVELFCRTWNPPGTPYEDVPSAAAIIQFAGGTVATYEGSWVSTGPQTFWSGDWRMECDQGEIAWSGRIRNAALADLDRLSIKPIGQPAERISLQADPAASGRTGSLRAFVQAVQSGEYPPLAASAADNIGSVAFMQAMVESSRTGMPVQLNHD